MKPSQVKVSIRIEMSIRAAFIGVYVQDHKDAIKIWACIIPFFPVYVRVNKQ